MSEDYLFSEELREAMKEFGNMDVRDALESREWWGALATHAGMPQEDLERLFKENDEKVQAEEDAEMERYEPHRDTDTQIGTALRRCRRVMRGLSTEDKMTACYNLTLGVLRLFCVCSEEKVIIDMVQEFCDGFKEEVRELYREGE